MGRSGSFRNGPLEEMKRVKSAVAAMGEDSSRKDAAKLMKPKTWNKSAPETICLSQNGEGNNTSVGSFQDRAFKNKDSEKMNCGGCSKVVKANGSEKTRLYMGSRICAAVQHLKSCLQVLLAV